MQRRAWWFGGMHTGAPVQAPGVRSGLVPLPLPGWSLLQRWGEEQSGKQLKFTSFEV